MRSVKCVAHGGGRADVGIGPYEIPPNPGRNRVPVPGGHTGRPYGDRRGCGVQWLGRCVQHGLQENSIAPGGVVYQDMGDGPQ